MTATEFKNRFEPLIKEINPNGGINRYATHVHIWKGLPLRCYVADINNLQLYDENFFYASVGTSSFLNKAYESQTNKNNN